MKAALVGTGRIGYLLEKDPYRYHPCTHAGSLAFFENITNKKAVELIAACDIDSNRIASFQKWYRTQTSRTINAYTQFADLLQKHSNIDFLIIATPIDSHEAIITDSIKAGIKRILVEKPICFSAKSIQKIRKIIKNDQRVWVNFERRYHRNYLLNKAIVKSSSTEQSLMKELRHIHGRVLTGSAPSPEGGGPLLHDAIHWIDLLFFTCGLPENVSYSLDYSDHSPNEHTAYLTFHYDHFQAELISGNRRRYFEFFMQLDFKDGRILSSNTNHKYYRSGKSKNYKNFMELQLLSESQNQIKKFLRKEENPWVAMYQSLIKDEPECMLQQMLPVHSLIDSCYKKRKGSWSPA